MKRFTILFLRLLQTVMIDAYCVVIIEECIDNLKKYWSFRCRVHKIKKYARFMP